MMFSTKLLLLVAFLSLFATLGIVVVVEAFEPPAPAPSPTTRSPTLPPVVQFTPNQACTCQALLRVCDPPTKCLCQYSVTGDGCACARSDSDTGIALVCGTFDCCEGQQPRRRQQRHKLRLLLEKATSSEETQREEPYRSLMGADFAFDPNDPVHRELYNSYLEECGNQQYNVWLYVTHHLYAVAAPTTTTTTEAGANDGQTSCPFLVTHARFEDPTSKSSSATKKLLFWETREEGEDRFASATKGNNNNNNNNNNNWQDKSYLVGQFTLKDLATAYEKVDPSKHGPYDVVTNNCAHYIIRLALELGIKIDSGITKFVIGRLTTESSSQMMDMLREGMMSSQSSLWIWFYKHYICFYWNLMVSWWLWGPSEAVKAGTTTNDSVVGAQAGIGDAMDAELLKNLVSEQARALL